jgi:hypothetical protein
MAVIPNKFAPKGKTDKEKIANLEAYIKYLEERIELFATTINKKFEEDTKK